jgi:hypothetical protein
MVKSVVGDCHGSRDVGTSNDDLTLRSDDELAWWPMIWSSGVESGDDNTREIKVLPSRVKIQGLALI